MDSVALLTAVSIAASKIFKVQAEYFINLLFRNIWMIFRISNFLGSWLGSIRCVRCQLFNALMLSHCCWIVNLEGCNSFTNLKKKREESKMIMQTQQRPREHIYSEGPEVGLSDLSNDCWPPGGAAGLFQPTNKSRRSGKYRRPKDSTPSLGQSRRQKPLRDIFS